MFSVGLHVFSVGLTCVFRWPKTSVGTAFGALPVFSVGLTCVFRRLTCVFRRLTCVFLAVLPAFSVRTSA